MSFLGTNTILAAVVDRSQRNPSFWGHSQSIPSVVFEAMELSGKSVRRVFICNLMSDCCRAWLWYPTLLPCTLPCVTAFCSCLTPNLSEITPLGNSVHCCAWDGAQGVSPKQVCDTSVGEFHYIQREKATPWGSWWPFCLVSDTEFWVLRIPRAPSSAVSSRCIGVCGR